MVTMNRQESKNSNMTNLNFKEVETFLNSNPDFLGTFLAKNDLSKNLSQRIESGPTLSMSKCVEKLVNQQRIQKKKIIDATMDENQRFSEFVKDIAGELNVDALSHKILQNVINLTESDRGRLFLVEGLNEKSLVSKLFDVTATSHLNETIQCAENAIHIPFGKGIVGIVAELKIPMNIKDAHEDPRFDPEVDKLAGYQTRCILCMPILNKEGEVVGVAEIMNKKNVDHFSEQDEVLFSEYLNFCGIGINNARLFQMSIEEIHRNQLLLNLAWQISAGQSSIDHVTKVILEYALKIIKCKFASIFLLNTNSGSFSKIYRLNSSDSDVIITKGESKNAYTTIAKESLQNKEKMYVTNLNDYPEFVACAEISSEQNKDENKLYEEDANWVLCASVYDLSDVSIGCIMFAGKAKPLTRQADANSVEAFAVYCGLGIYNCQLYQTTVKSLTVKQIVLEILSYHMTSEKVEVDRYVKLDMPSANECKLYDYKFNDVVLSEVSTVQTCALMFLKMNALNILGISLEQLYHWILTVKKNHKPLLYHNWRHAVNVSQTMFCALNKGALKKYFSPFECICLLVASLCHDLDYEGSCSAQTLKSTSLLATIYSTSSSEHQVLGRCVMILNSDPTNIFQNLTAEKYRQAMELIKKAIFATDIYVYLINAEYFENLKKKKAPLLCEQDKDLFVVLTMVSCDLIAFSKPWNNHKILVLAATLELFEPPESGNEAPALQKSESHKIPTMMIEFIDIVCINVFKTMSEFDESFLLLLDGCIENRKHWDKIVRQINEFDLETELNKSRAGFIDFDEPLKELSDEKVNGEKVVTANEDRENMEKEEKKQEGITEENKEIDDNKIEEKKEEELEPVGCEEERERMQRAQERKENEEKEIKEKAEKEERERKEKEEKEEREKKEKEERERKEKEEKEEREKREKERKEKEEREKEEKERQMKELEEKERKAREEKEKEMREKMEMEEKIKKENEKRIAEMKEKEEKERKEKEMKEEETKKEKEEKERIEKEKEAAKKEMEAKKKKEKEAEKLESAENDKEKTSNADDDSEPFKDNLKEQLMARMSDKLINLKSPAETAVSSREESCSTLSPSPAVSPKMRQTSKQAESPAPARKLSYRQPDESEIQPPSSMKREMSRRKSCIEEIAEENLKHKTEKKNRRGSANRVSPIDQVQRSPVQSPPKNQDKSKKKKSQQQLLKAEDDTAVPRRTSVVRSDSAKQRIKASTNQSEKRKCAPRAPTKEFRKNIPKSSFCSII